MRKFYFVYGGIVILFVVMKILGWINWWAATAVVWFPLAVVLSLALAITITTDIGNLLKRRRESKIIPKCENCIFKSTQQMLNEEKCFGQKFGAEIVDEKCSYYSKK